MALLQAPAEMPHMALRMEEKQMSGRKKRGKAGANMSMVWSHHACMSVRRVETRRCAEELTDKRDVVD
eukprot:2335466-Rhodomonas_salina.1